jgi:hypothetical protein
MEFSDPTLTLERVFSANSIVTSWIQSPVASGNSVIFSGIMPGGYESVVDPVTGAHMSGTVLTLVFKAHSPGSAVLSFSDSHVYLNDGLGTETGLTSLPYTFTIGPQGTGMKTGSADTTPPEAFTPIVSSSPDLFKGAYAVFFGTTDKGTGIDYYEVSEGSGDWIRAESPYKLSDQTLRSTIRVKAVDLAGNYLIEEIPGTLSFSKSLLLIPFGLIIIFLIVIFVIYERKMKQLKDRFQNK